MDLIPAVQIDDALLADIESAEDRKDCFHLWWLGQSGFLVKWNRDYLLLDPYLSDSLTRKYADTDKPHVRMTELAVDPARLGFVKLVTSSHNHTDHLDRETLTAIADAADGITLVLPAANIDFAKERLEGAPVNFLGLDAGTSTSSGPWQFTGVPAAHNDVARDERGRCRFLGFLVSFGTFSIYHSGDTLRHDGLAPALADTPQDLALLPINGHKPERRVAGNLNGSEAATLAHTIGAKTVVPCHYHMFTFNTEEPDEFVTACRELEQGYNVMRCGERLTIG